MSLILSGRRRAARFLFRTAVVWIFNWSGLCAGAEEGLFDRSSMTEIEREGVRIRLGQPIQVTSQLAWQVRIMGQEKVDSGGWDMGWAFLHPVPCIARFPGGELMVTYSLVPDTNANPMDITGLQISRDGGKTWGRRHTILPEHQPMIYVPQKEGNSLMGIPAYIYPRSEGDRRNFTAPYYRFEEGGRRIVVEPDGVQVVDWPWDVPLNPSGFARMSFDGNALEVDGRLLATAQSKERMTDRPPTSGGYVWETQGDQVWQRNVLLSSQDGGRTWRYFSTLADSSILPRSPGKQGAEGPTETALIRLEDGDLMAVFRVGSGRGWNLRRAYSSDGGRSWSKAEPIPPYSVEPSMLRLENGVIVISTGRPGIGLWLSTDGRGKDWQQIDIMDYHNSQVPDSTYRIGSWGTGKTQTSAYTEMVEVSPNRLLLVYDRGAKPKPAHTSDLSRIFVLPVEVESPGELKVR